MRVNHCRTQIRADTRRLEQNLKTKGKLAADRIWSNLTGQRLTSLFYQKLSDVICGKKDFAFESRRQAPFTIISWSVIRTALAFPHPVYPVHPCEKCLGVSLLKFWRAPVKTRDKGHATYFVAVTLHTETQRSLTCSRTKKEGVYAISMGIIHGNIFEHGLRLCHFVAFNNLGVTNLRFCGLGGARVPDHLHFYSHLDPAFLPVAANL